VQATGAATDAEQDIALACIFAQHLVDEGKGGREGGREGKPVSKTDYENMTVDACRIAAHPPLPPSLPPSFSPRCVKAPHHPSGGHLRRTDPSIGKFHTPPSLSPSLAPSLPSLVGVWQPHTTPQGATYGERAQQILDAMWDTGMIQDGK